MSEVPEEDVIAFVDGRLGGPALPAFEARLREDRALAERVAAHRWMARQIVAAYGAPPDDDVDETLLVRLGLTDDNVAKTGMKRPVPARRPFGALWTGGALAAGLFAGLFIGMAAPTPASWFRTDAAGGLIAGGVLAEGLSNRMSGESGALHIGLSFRTVQGICRTFSTPEGMSGLGCRQGSHWTVPIVVTGTTAPDRAAEYRLASGDVAPAVMSEVDRRMIGAPLTPVEERSLKDSDWTSAR